VTGKTELQEALDRGMEPGGDLSAALVQLGSYPIESVADAEAVVAALRRYAVQNNDTPEMRGRLHPLASLFQDVATEEAFGALDEQGIPILVEVFDRELPVRDEREADDLLFLLKVFVLYKSEAGMRRIAVASRERLQPDSYVWAVIFENLDERNPHWRMVCEALRDPLPTGFAAVTFLDFANQMAEQDELHEHEHPFDSPAGIALLRQWLRSDDPEEYSFAQSATTALPFLTRPERNELLALALEHPDETVQLEAAWAAAKLGSEEGVQQLVRFCHDPAHSTQACAYLEELGRDDLIPAEACDPDFQAMAEMCSWLAHPQEYGDVPDSLELYDTRRLYWPPTDDERQVWLFKYTYEPDTEGGDPETGVGMVGGVTFALFGESTPDMPPEDIYALHCCWELEMSEDPRAPEQRSVEAGRKLLNERS
jgi:hypothetical protein